MHIRIRVYQTIKSEALPQIFLAYLFGEAQEAQETF